MNNSDNRNLFQLLLPQIERPGATLIDRPGGSSVSYGQMVERSGKFANILVSLGVRPGDRVAAQIEKSIDALFLYLGCLRAGAVFLPLNTAYTQSELVYFINDAEPRLIVCAPEKLLAMEQFVTDGSGRIETLGEDGLGSLAVLVDRAQSRFENIYRGR